MERIDSINPQRIAWCCRDQGITLEQLAGECGIPPARMQKVMEQADGLTFNQLQSVAEFFGRGVLFFLEEEPVVTDQVHTPQFRTLTNQKPELSSKLRVLIERVERHRDFYLSLRQELEDKDYSHFRPPEVDPGNPAEAAAIARRWLKLKDTNSFDTYRNAVEARGMLVFRSNGYSGKWQIARESPILGFSIYDRACPVIVVKKLEWEPRQSFTLMHELGHILLQRASSIDDDGDFQSHQGAEQAANAFAGNLLVPNSFLRQINDDTQPARVSEFDEWLEPQRRAWGVSGETILRRLLDADRLSRTQYESYRRWRNRLQPANDDSGSRAYRHREPRHIFGDAYVKTVLTSLSARAISLTKASTYLDKLKVKDIKQLEGYYANL